MDKELARRNLRFGVVLFIVLLLMFGLSFAWAALYLRAVS